MGKRLSDDVYIVKGRKKACIYDFNNKKLYHIDNALALLIEDVVENNKNIFTVDENEAIKKLEALGIIVYSSTNNNKISSILELKSNDNRINFAWIEVCDYCNLKCIHCYNESSPKCQNAMSLSDFIYICDNLVSIGVKRIQIIGGEPFCNKELKEMLQYAVANFEFIEIFTNGTLIDDTWCEFISKNNIQLALSIYSYIDYEHDKVTKVAGSHLKTTNLIKLIKKHNIQHRIATVHMKGISIGEKDTDYYTLNEEKDVIRMVGRGTIDLLTPELLRRKLITRKTFSKPLNVDLVKANVKGNRCFASKIYISVNLEVYPCVMERRISHGNLRNNALTAIIKKEIQELNIDKVKYCQECEFRYACCDCRPDSFTYDIYERPYYCSYNINLGVFESEDIIIENVMKNK